MKSLDDIVLEELRSQISLDAVREARGHVYGVLSPTPLIRHPLLVDALGCEVHVKHENHLPTGSFKVRGGVNYIAHLPQDQKERGVVAATRGNHGQSVARAAQQHGVRAVIVVPRGNNPEKNAAMRAYGAELIEEGSDFDEARRHAERLVKEEGLTLVHNANEPHLINGVGTYSLEIYEELPEVDILIVPVGGGSGICGAITVFRALKPQVQIIGVQAANAPAVHDSWVAGEICTTETADTFADGLATRVPFELPFAILSDELDDMILVSENEIRDAIRLLLETTHNLAEGAGAAPIAALKKRRDEWNGKTIAVILSGGNIDTKTLRWVLNDPA